MGVPGAYVYGSGKFIQGIFLTWFLLAGLFWLPYFDEIISGHFSNRHPLTFPDGRGPFASLMLGWFYGIVVSLAAMVIRFAFAGLRRGFRKN
jgi:hypothetical protein